VGEVEKPIPVRPFKVSGVGPDGVARFRATPTLMGLNLPFEAFASQVAASWFTAPAPPFARPRGFPKTRQPTPKRRRLPWAWSPLQGATRPTPQRPREAPATLVGFRAPTATTAGEVH
jgi:hypothetical protein